jgi:hypothetical protein
MYERETKNINKLLEHVKVPGIMVWKVGKLRDMEWDGHIRLELNVVYDWSYYEHKYPNYYQLSDYQYDMKQKIIRVFKHYVHSFLGLKIGDVKTVHLISYQFVNPTSNYYTYTNYDKNYFGQYSYEDYDWFG